MFSLLKVRQGKLEWLEVIRSNDVFRGVPYNFIQFTSLQEIMAGWLGLEMGSYNQISDSLHIYENDLDHVRGSSPLLAKENNDTLALAKSDSDKVFAELDLLASQIACDSKIFSAEDVRKVQLPNVYRNLFSVLAAEAARRKHLTVVSGEIMSICTNPLLRQVYDRWQARYDRR